MKKIFAIVLPLISLSTFGQQWIEYKVDSTLTLLLPDNYETTDTIGQKVITAQIDNGLILLTAISNTSQTSIKAESEKDLIDSYTGFRKGFINSQNGQLIEEKILDNNGLKFIRFSYKATMEGERQIRHCIGVFVNEKMYAINFWELEEMTDEMTREREQLFSSLKFATGLTLENQLSHSVENSTSYKVGYVFGKVLGYVLIISLFVIVIVWLTKKLRK